MPFPKLSTWLKPRPMARRSEHKGDFFVEYSTDGTGRPGSSSLRPLGLKPVRPLRFRRKTCSQSRPKHNTLTPRTRARPLASQADKTRAAFVFSRWCGRTSIVECASFDRCWCPLLPSRPPQGMCVPPMLEGGPIARSSGWAAGLRPN